MKTSLTYKFATFMQKYGKRVNLLENPQVREMRQEIASFKDGIEFTVSTYDDGSWSAKSTNVEGIITGSRNISEMPELIKDAIFTYYDIPPQYCNDSLLRGSGEKKTLKKEVYITA